MKTYARKMMLFILIMDWTCAKVNWMRNEDTPRSDLPCEDEKSTLESPMSICAISSQLSLKHMNHNPNSICAIIGQLSLHNMKTHVKKCPPSSPHLVNVYENLSRVWPPHPALPLLPEPPPQDGSQGSQEGQENEQARGGEKMEASAIFTTNDIR